MLLHNHPATSYISWFGLVIIDTDETQYIITDGKSCKKYIYWEKENPYILKESDEWIKESTTKKMIYINDFGTGTEVPRNEDDIKLYYNDTGNGSTSRLVGEALGKYDELNGKYIIIQEDVNGIKEALGSETSEGNSIIERLNKIEKTAEGTEEKISEVKREYADDKELEELRNNINVSIVNIGEALSYYEEAINEMSKDLEVSNDEKLTITSRQTTLLDSYEALSQYHQILIQRLNKVEGNSKTVADLNKSIEALKTSINNLNKNVSDAMSDNTISPTDLTTMLSMIANAGLKNNDYKNLVSDAILLGIGGRLTESVLNIKKTSNEFSQTMSKMVEEIDGETGLKKVVAEHSTVISQNSDEISMKCVKYDKETSNLTVGDGVIKLDASQVLLTGTLTWDSLDDEAKQNLKGENGTAEYVMLTGDQIIKYNKNLEPDIKSIKLTAQVSNISNPTFSWYYRNKDDEEWTHIADNENKSSITITHNNYMWSTESNSLSIRVVCGGYSYDKTIVKLYDGYAGKDSKSVKVTGEQLFKYKNNFLGTPTPSSITLTGIKNNITSTTTRWYYRTSENSEWTQISSAVGMDSLTISHDSSYFGDSKILMVRFEAETYYDVITLAKISDGGDGYFVLLTNENHSVPCDENGNYLPESLEDAYTEIHVYKGLDEVDFSLNKTDNGCTSSYNSSTKKLTITKLTKKVATVTLDIYIGDVYFQKVMTITKSIKGDKGADGAGVNIIGHLNDVSQLPTTGKIGDAYIINGLIYIWLENEQTWSDGMPFQGEQGIPGKNGDDGRTTYLHIKYSNDGKTFTSNNGEDPGDWLGQYVDFTEKDSTVFSDYTWKKIKGRDGDNGIVANLSNDTHLVPVLSDGTVSSEALVGCTSKISLSYNGTEITDDVVYSYTASSGITGNWDSTTGTFTVTGWTGSSSNAYVDFKATYNGVTYKKRFSISKHRNGEDGSDARMLTLSANRQNIAFTSKNKPKNSTAITLTANQQNFTDEIVWATSPSGITLTGSGKTRTLAVSNFESIDSIKVTITSESLSDEITFNKIMDGTDGVDNYTWIKYSPESNGDNMTDTPYDYTNTNAYSQKINSAPSSGWKDLQLRANYLTGTLYINNIKVKMDGDSETNYASTTSLKMIGEDTSNQTAVITIPNSDNLKGKSFTVTFDYRIENHTKEFEFYTQTKGDTSDGGTATWQRIGEAINIYKNTQYIGIAYNKTTATESTIASDYKWSKFSGKDGTDGLDGTDGYTIFLSNESHTFAGGVSSAIASSITFNVEGYKGSNQIPTTIGTITGMPTGMTTSISNNGTSDTTITVKVTTSMTSRSGVLNIPVTIDGSTFDKQFSYSLSLVGKDGINAYTIVLSNENHTFAGTKEGAIKSSTSCNVSVYKGTQLINATIGTITGMPTGMTTSISNNGTTSPSFTVNVTSSMTKKNGTLNIPITADGVSLSKQFSYALALEGTTGLDGENAKALFINADRQVVVYKNGKPKDSTAITLTANQQNFTDTISWTTSPSVTLTGSGKTRTLAVSNFNSNDKIKVTISAGGLSDTVTINKLSDGVDGLTAKTLSLNTSRQSIGFTSANVAKDKTDIKLTAVQQNFNDEITWTTSPTVSLGGSGKTRTLAVSNFNSNDKIKVTISAGGLSDTVTIGKVVDGTNGKNAYTWIKYSPESDGSDMTDVPYDYTNTRGFSGTISSSPSSGWKNLSLRTDYLTGTLYIDNISVKLDGDSETNYASTKSLIIVGENTSNKRALIALTNSDILKGKKFTVTFDYKIVGHTRTCSFHVQTYGDTSDGGTATWKSIGSTVNILKNTMYIGMANNKTTATESTIASDYKWSKFKGDEGISGYGISLSNESHTFAGGVSSAIAGSTVCKVTVYEGNKKIPATIGTITGQVTGMTTTIQNNSSTTAQFTVNVTSSMTTKNGVLNIPITANGITFNKTFSYALSLKGDTGTPGKDGSNGKTTYFHVKYSSVAKPTSSSQMTETPSTYIGTYVDYTQADSTDPNKYTWARFQGLQGAKGDQGIPGTNGANGKTYYLHIKYSNDGGATFTSNNGEDPGKYIGVYTDTTQADSTSVSKYTWSQVKGDPGEDGYTINISNDNHSFMANSKGNIETQQATSTVVTAFKGTTAITPSFGAMPTVSGLEITRSGTTITIKALTGTSLAKHGSFNIPVIVGGKTFNKAFSYSKVNSGENGKDAYTIMLTNTSHVFPCENNGNIATATSTTTQVKAYKGTTEVTPAISLPSVSGLTLSKSGTTITIKANTGTSLASSGKFDITITVDGINFIKSFSWAKAFKGNNGTDATVPNWIKEWDSGKTTINNSTVLAPKIFAGTVSSGKPTGVALGKNVFGTSGTYANVNGMVGYKNGNKIYEFNSNGNIIWGNTSGKYLSWDGTNLKINASTINLGSSSVATETGVVDKINGIKIGGTNLVSNSAPKSTSGWGASTGWTASLVDKNSAPYGKAIRVTNNSGTNGGCHKQPVDYSKCTNGANYTISAWIRASKSCTINFRNEMQPNNYIDITTSWKQYTYTATIDTSATYHSNVFYVTNETCSTGMWLEVHSLKFERGTKNTSWSPSPEEIDDNIKTVNDRFGNYSTTTEMNSAIKSAKDSINLSVSEKYTTKTEFGNLRIGGANLLRTTKLLENKSGSSEWEVANTGSEGFKKLQIVTTDATKWIECQIPLYTTINSLTSKVTISFEYQETTAGLLVFNFASYNGNTRLKEIENWVVANTFTVLGTREGWKRVSYTFDPTSVNGQSGATTYKAQFKKNDNKSGTVYIRKIKLEIGTVATEWTPAPQDTDDYMSSIESRVEKAELKLTKDKLTSTIGDYYTTSTDVNGIVTSKGYATTSQLTQTKKEITATFTESGGYNLIRNSSGLLDTNSWNSNGMSFYISSGGDVPKKYSSTKCFVAENIDTTEKFVYSSWIQLKPNTKYTLSGIVSANADCTGVDVYIIQNTAIDGSGTNTYSKACGYGTASWWKEFKYTFTTKSDTLSCRLRVDNNGATSTKVIGKIYFGDLLLEEGEVAHPWSPHPNEVRSGITQIDAKGIKVFHDSVDSDSYTHMSPSGFYLKNRGTNVFKVDSNGLTMQGNITGGSININSGTFKVTDKGYIEAKSTPNGSGQYLWIKNSSYKIFKNSKVCAMHMGFRDLTFENGNTTENIPSIYMGADGINAKGGTSYTGGTGRYYARWYTTDENNSMTETHTNMPSMMFEFNSKFTNKNTNHPIASQIKMFADGHMIIAPVRDLEIRTHEKDGSVTADGTETVVANFCSSGSDYYANRIEARALCNLKNSKGLQLADYYNSSAGNGYDGTNDIMCMLNIHAGMLSDGTKHRTVRPHLDGTHELGSSSHRWKKIYCSSSSISTSDRRCKTNINYLTADNENAPRNCSVNKSDIWNFVRDIDYASYNFIDNEGNADKENQFGFILQDLIQSYPDITNNLLLDSSARVTEEGVDDTVSPLMGYNTNNYVNLLGCALQQALKRIEELEDKINK